MLGKCSMGKGGGKPRRGMALMALLEELSVGKTHLPVLGRYIVPSVALFGRTVPRCRYSLSDSDVHSSAKYMLLSLPRACLANGRDCIRCLCMALQFTICEQGNYVHPVANTTIAPMRRCSLSHAAGCHRLPALSGAVYSTCSL